MRRGTTPTFTFTIPFNVSIISSFRLIFKQEKHNILVKNNSECALSDNSISVTLSQKETLSFDAEKPVMAQLRVLTKSGEALSSQIVVVDIKDTLDEEVLV